MKLFQSSEELIQAIFGDLHLHYMDQEWYTSRPILALTNKRLKEFNLAILDTFPVMIQTPLSPDYVQCKNPEMQNIAGLKYSQELSDSIDVG